MLSHLPNLPPVILINMLRTVNNTIEDLTQLYYMNTKHFGYTRWNQNCKKLCFVCLFKKVFRVYQLPSSELKHLQNISMPESSWKSLYFIHTSVIKPILHWRSFSSSSHRTRMLIAYRLRLNDLKHFQILSVFQRNCFTLFTPRSLCTMKER